MPPPPGAAAAATQALSQDEDDAFMHSGWANSQSLKQHFSGVTSVRIPH